MPNSPSPVPASTAAESTAAQSIASSRRLSGALEPFVGCVYFAPECHTAYAAMGFAASARSVNGVAMPDGPAYFTSRGSLLGQVHGNLVASAFAVFNPAVVVPSVAHGWTITDASTIRTTRQEATGTFLHRVLSGDQSSEAANLARVTTALSRGVDACAVEGRPLFAGVMAGTQPTGDPLTHAWFLGDALREARGDSHTAAWISHGLDAIEIGLLTESYWGLPFKSYVRTRAWTDEQLDAGIDRLTERGLIADGALTEAGRSTRELIEMRTDAQMNAAVGAMGHDLEPVLATLNSWSASVRAAHGYPMSGPQDLASTARSISSASSEAGAR